MRKILLIKALCLCFFSGMSQTELFPNANQRWVDSVFKSLSLDQKIGQLFMPRANVGAKYEVEKLLDWVRDYHVGGFVFFAGSPTVHARNFNLLQKTAKVPLMIGMDLEWGLAMRIDSSVRFPYQMTLGAMQGNDELIEEMGREVGRQCRRIGVHVNYAPTVDVNNNPNNPVINFRSFGENPQDVTRKALAYMRGMQKENIITSIKHFPGHGDTGVDSHYDVPLIPHNKARLDSVEIYPFRKLIEAGAVGVMVAHLNIPALDTTKNLASTLSKKIVTDLLRKDLKFNGLVFTDAMDMQGAVKYFPNGKANIKAILAGNDILETFVDVPTAFNAVKEALKNGEITEAELDVRVRKILLAKAWAGLDKYQPVDLKNLIAELNPLSSDLLNRQLAEKTVTVLKNESSLLPIRNLETLTIATLSIGSEVLTPFQKLAEKYTSITHFNILPTAADSTQQALLAKLKTYDLVLVATNGLNIRPKDSYQATPAYSALLKKVLAQGNCVLNLFANILSINKLDGLENARAFVATYQDTPYSQEAAAHLIFGATGCNGRLPLSVNQNFKYGMGQKIQSLGRLKYTTPEEAGINGKFLSRRIDSLVNQALSQKATPGAVVLVAKSGKVIFEKAYGYQTYEGKQAVKTSDIYDLASVTKITTSVPALMKLQDMGKFSLKTTMGELIPDWKTSNKNELVYKDILTHQARLKAWIPFWKDCIDSVAMLKNSPLLAEKHKELKPTFWEKLFSKKKYNRRLMAALLTDKHLWSSCVNIAQTNTIWKANTFAENESADYSIQVGDRLWLHKNYAQKILDAIRDSPLQDKKEYVYSDLSYYLYPQIWERVTGKDWQTFLKENFYNPLGAKTLTYNARQYFDLGRLVPTEYDSLFRKNLIHGRVHDEGASMLDGVSGHAGLFGSANDVAKLGQMYLQRGQYAGKRYIEEKTLNEWTSYPFSVSENSRRGVGFDKPDRKKAGISAAPSASAESFGHSGFTGTYLWIDPKYDLVYVFLSNRVYPTRNNNKLSELSTRSNINEAIIEAIKKGINK
jgi:beta-N-acetylhexosaminidase